MIENRQKEKIKFPDKCYYCGSMSNELRKIMEEKWITKIGPLMRSKTFCPKFYKRIKVLLKID